MPLSANKLCDLCDTEISARNCVQHYAACSRLQRWTESFSFVLAPFVRENKSTLLFLPQQKFAHQNPTNKCRLKNLLLGNEKLPKHEGSNLIR
eukprot:TRINITY_DN12247_c0_g1_i1.p1 TRINITY_DN12247_c0_g1~~TRINITY_DN12247_c0_g1_i1.p1  ORF type:complete len:104 (+),score=12.12 TRINITY_DN12247_c0_g1_i1:34-312(+)